LNEIIETRFVMFITLPKMHVLEESGKTQRKVRGGWAGAAPEQPGRVEEKGETMRVARQNGA
jgi:hypothetical protein